MKSICPVSVGNVRMLWVCISESYAVCILMWCIVDMSKPVHRHLVEQRWRNEGGLDLLVRRFVQSMEVGPEYDYDYHRWNVCIR